MELMRRAVHDSRFMMLEQGDLSFFFIPPQMIMCIGCPWWNGLMVCAR